MSDEEIVPVDMRVDVLAEQTREDNAFGLVLRFVYPDLIATVALDGALEERFIESVRAGFKKVNELNEALGVEE